MKKTFFFNPPVNHQNDRVWSDGKKQDVNKSRLVVETANLPSTSWFLLVCAKAEKEDSISFQTKQK